MTIAAILALALLAPAGASVAVLAFEPAAAADRPRHDAPTATARASAEALRIARESRAGWSLGRLAVRDRQGRPPRVRADLLHDGTVVGRLRIDPGTGGFLPRREPGEALSGPLDLPGLQAAAGRALAEIEIGGWTWPVGCGRAWGVPLLYRGRVVGTVAVDVRGGRLLPVDDEENDRSGDD